MIQGQEGLLTTSMIPTPEYYLHLLWDDHNDGSREPNAWAIVMPATAGRREALLKAADFQQTWMMQVLEEGTLNWMRVPLKPYLAFRTDSWDFEPEVEDSE